MLERIRDIRASENDREVLQDFGTVKREVAEKLALEQYEQFDAHRRMLEADEIDELAADVKRLHPEANGGHHH